MSSSSFDGTHFLEGALEVPRHLFRSESKDRQSVSADRFVEWDSLYELLSSGAVALLKGSWLVDFAEASQDLLPRRQDLPGASFWQPDELFELSRTGRRELRRGHEIISISHGWLSAEHPDPDRSQVEKLGRYVKAWSDTQSGLLPRRIAIFVDWCGLMQEPRTPAESSLFARAQENAHLWYAHRHVRVMLLTSMPKVAGGQPADPYQMRGWPHFEMALAVLNAHWGGEVLDMGRCESGARHLERGWPCTNVAMSALVSANNAALDSATFQICSLPRRPPLTPKMFARTLENKVFTDSSDICTLIKQYTMTFDAFATSVELLDFSGLEWGDWEAEMVADALPSFTRLRELNLSNNEITEIGAGLLAEEIPRCPSLSKLLLTENEIMEGLEGSVRLREAWGDAGKNEHWLLMSFPTRSEYVRKKIGSE